MQLVEESMCLIVSPSHPSPLIQGYFHSLSCVNTELLSLGLATLEESPPGCHGTDGAHNEELIAFLSEGVRAEGSAQRRGEGVWRGSVHKARWRKVARFLRLKN